MSRAKQNAVAISCAIDWENVPLATRSEAEVQAWIKRTRGVDIDIETIRHRKMIMGLRVESRLQRKEGEISVHAVADGNFCATFYLAGEPHKGPGEDKNRGARQREASDEDPEGADVRRRDLVTADGWRKLLDCPVCGEPCRTIKPMPMDNEYPFPWWVEGETGTCQCGAELVVDVDDGRAWLEERTEKEGL